MTELHMSNQLYENASAFEDDVTHSACSMLTELRNEANKQRPDVDTILTSVKNLSKKFALWCQAVEELTSSHSKNPSQAIRVNVAKLDQILNSAQDNNSAQVKQKGDITLIVTNSHKHENKENEPSSCTGVIQSTHHGGNVNAVTRAQLSLVTSWFDCDNQIETSLRTAFDKLLASFRSSPDDETKTPASAADHKDDNNYWWISDISAILLEYKVSQDTEICWTEVHHKLSEVEMQLKTRDSASCSQLIEVINCLNLAAVSYKNFHRDRCQFQRKLQQSLSHPAVLRASNDTAPHHKQQRKFYAIKLTTVDTFVKEETVCISPTNRSAPMVLYPIKSSDNDVTDASHGDPSRSKINGRLNGDYPQSHEDDLYMTSSSAKPRTSDNDVTDSSRNHSNNNRQDGHVNGNWFTADDNEVNMSSIPNKQSTVDDHSAQPSSVDRADDTYTQNSGPTTESVDDDVVPYNGSMKNGTRRETVEADQMTSVSHEESVKFLVKSVVDPRNGKEITIDQAVRDGIVDHRTGQYINPATGESCPIGEAMNDGRIRIERVVTTSRSAEERRSVGLITIRVQTDTREYAIKGAVDMATGQTLTADEARKRAIVDEASGSFVNTLTGEKMALSEAVEAGHVIADFDADAASSQTPCETKTYAVCAVVDQVERKPVPFPEAVKRGLIDRHTGCYINNVTGERVFAGDAVKRGLFKCRTVDDTSTFDEIDESNRVVADRIQHVRSNVLRNMKILSALKKSATAK